MEKILWKLLIVFAYISAFLFLTVLIVFYPIAWIADAFDRFHHKVVLKIHDMFDFLNGKING